MKPHRARSTRWTGGASVCVLLALSIGCSEATETTEPAISDPALSAVSSTSTVPTASAPATNTDPDQSRAESDPSADELREVCALLTDDEVELYLVSTDPGESVSDSVCEWRNPATEETVTLTVSEAGTAADGQLDEPSDYGDTEPVPEMGSGARFAPGFGIVEFIVDDRVCEIQVAVLGDGRAAAVALATLVRERI